MEIVVKGRRCEVPDRFRQHVSDKLTKLERLDHKLIRIEVEASREPNPRLADHADRIELTVRSKGPVIRAEAASDDRYAALDAAVDKLVSRLRKAADRRRVHRGRRTPISVAEATARVNGGVIQAETTTAEPTPDVADHEASSSGPMVVREKTHDAKPMSLDQALYEMELVGHDFYLFVDDSSGHPSVVYRRKGYDYGVIRLAI